VIVGGNVGSGFPGVGLDCDREVAGPRYVFVARLSPDLDIEALHLLGGSGGATG
jgi:hypothetical protein